MPAAHAPAEAAPDRPAARTLTLERRVRAASDTSTLLRLHVDLQTERARLGGQLRALDAEWQRRMHTATPADADAHNAEADALRAALRHLVRLTGDVDACLGAAGVVTRAASGAHHGGRTRA